MTWPIDAARRAFEIILLDPADDSTATRTYRGANAARALVIFAAQQLCLAGVLSPEAFSQIADAVGFPEEEVSEDAPDDQAPDGVTRVDAVSAASAPEDALHADEGAGP